MPKRRFPPEPEASPPSDRAMPHSLDAERAVLGASLTFPSAFPVAASCLTPGEFFRDAHRRIFTVMTELLALGVEADFLTVKERLAGKGELEECGGPAYLASLADGVPRSANIGHYAAIVREKARLRALIETASGLMTAAYVAERPAAEILSEASAKLHSGLVASADRPAPASEAAQEFMREVDEGLVLLPTGLADVDGLIGGVALGDLTLVAARPSVGKTSFALGIADHVAHAGHAAVCFSLEMRRSQLGARLLSWRARVSAEAMRRGTATAAQYARVPDAAAALEGVPLLIDDRSRSVTEIEAWCRRSIAERGTLSCVVVDYLQLATPAGKAESRQETVAAVSRDLKRIAKELKVAMVACCQLSRAPDSRSDKRPRLEDLRESGALEQDADVVMLLYRPSMHDDDPELAGLAECIVAKNRNGARGVVRTCFIEDYAQFANLARGE